MVNRQGQSAVWNGQSAEKVIACILHEKGFDFRRQHNLCDSIYGHPLRTDFWILNFPGCFNGLAIEIKWQQVGGSNDEKLPYLAMNIKQQFPCPTIVVIDGSGHKDGAVKWLYEQVDGKKLIHVFSIAEFLMWINHQSPSGSTFATPKNQSILMNNLGGQ